jgi:SAM-dependent methyltransferase
MDTSSKFYLQEEQYSKKRIAYWDLVAGKKKTYGIGSSGYHQRLQKIFQFNVAACQRVIEIGCGEGDLLASVHPTYGLGIDFSEHMIKRARKRHPELEFFCADGLEFGTDQVFDVIILSDIVNDVWDVQKLFEKMKSYSHPGTRVLINYYSRLWVPILSITEFLGLSQKTLEQNWLTQEDIKNLLGLSDFEIIKNSTEILFPLPIPVLESFCNQFLVRFWPFNQLAVTNLTIARLKPNHAPHSKANELSVTVVVPARNEAGNIQKIFERVPQMGKFTELIFVEGNSSDNTYAEIEKQMRLNPEVDCKLIKQMGKGKGDAVRLGFQQARGDILMIYDADLTVPTEYLPRFYQALADRKGEFINGVRLVYPMEKQAMRLVNFFGNKFFSIMFSWLLGQSVKDTLCGTKVLYKEDYLKISQNRSYFGDFDPFGDFDLLFGAAKLLLKIVDLPIRYQERTYGTTNIQRWKHGILLLRMIIIAALRLKFR